ncbi:MAG: hypothetical protein JW942_03855 [Opitutales bacterium]|nr:hypothetical protein [Opitutales bacterium]
MPEEDSHSSSLLVTKEKDEAAPSNNGGEEHCVFLANSLHLPRIGTTNSAKTALAPTPEDGRLRLEQHGPLLYGRWEKAVCTDVEQDTRCVYRQILGLGKEWSIARIWNLVPHINDCVNGLETYRSFSKARSEVFFQHYTAKANSHMPAATGIGRKDKGMSVSFIACKGEVSHHENPFQTPAYLYPPQYGPRPPSFARASTCRTKALHAAFISGTAAVVGHESICEDIGAECRITVENLKTMDAITRADNATGRTYRLINVFVRNASQHQYISKYLQEHWLEPEDRVSFYNADICRKELNLEIEFARISYF